MIINIANKLITEQKRIEHSPMPYISLMTIVRREFSHQALLKFEGNAYKASQKLNMNRRTFMSNLGMSAGEWKMKNMPDDAA
ncbi:hypothetical protein MMG00_12775 [Ignatzschineria rhizosphaerae]|uniref:DNA binding HTH domain-containing protein n=1 Tax=Ignatzschineria rhizosphaerae TaxID=2923279 RepID=A0ABY3X2D8_9GAMM|nr:hypothetical protein [Ignatzschineria rhizosphaerae]UNM96055.1 hypothetical protein MMG00_12775 [Ignatzschineria rhizosphaerae]